MVTLWIKTLSSSTDPILVLSGLCFGYISGGKDILNHLDLHMVVGERVAITGRSGAGKSTLLNILGLLQDGIRGRFLLHGKEPLSMKPALREEMRASCIGFVFQANFLIPYLTVHENIVLACQLSNQPGDRVDALIEGVGLSHRAHYFPTQLSGGEQQRVGVARALAKNPLLLLADEPTGNLDEATGNQVLDLMLDPEVYNGAIITVTHQERVARRFARRLQLQDGVLREEDLTS